MTIDKNGSTHNHPPPTSSRIPTMLAWEGTGVWVLDLTEEQLETYNLLPPTNDYEEHIENLKNFGAVWYEDPRDHAGATGVLDMESKVRDRRE